MYACIIHVRHFSCIVQAVDYYNFNCKEYDIHMQNKRCIYKQRYIKARHVQTQTSLYVRMSRLK